MRHFDLAVIGSGPAGQRAAIQASKLGKRVVVIERNRLMGGAAINTGTIPSKSLREAVLYLTGASRRGIFGDSHRVKKDITIADLTFVSRQVIHDEIELVTNHFERNGVTTITGEARFESANLLRVIPPPPATDPATSDAPLDPTVSAAEAGDPCGTADDAGETIRADRIMIAVGTRPATPSHVPFDGKSVFTSDGLLKLAKLPKSLIVVGGGVIGTEYACMMQTLGVKVTLVEGRNELLGFLDGEIIEAFQYHARQAGMTLRLGEKVAKIERLSDQKPPENGGGHAGGNGDAPRVPLVQATLESGKVLRAEALLYAVGRQGNTESLQLEKAGLKADERGRLDIDEHYRTAQPHIYAVGDIIGFPALASTSMEQGRLAACHAFGVPAPAIPEVYPFGIYAIPEISMIGQTEDQLTQAGVPYEAGIANYKEVARGKLLGDDTGMLKLLIHQTDHTLLGVHAIGTGATELIHIGQAVMALRGKIDFFVQNVFNYPTLAEAYRVAALNGMNKLRNV